jgi:large subunit ribosomal protein L29
MKLRTKELRQITPGELQTKLNEAKEEAFNLRFQRTSGQLEDLTRLQVARRNIARILTVLREKELEAESHAE